MAHDTLHVGFGEADITPPIGTQIAGDIGRPRPTETIKRPLYARATVFDNGDTAVCVLVLDILAINHDWSDHIRAEVSKRTGMPVEAIMLHTTQTHSAPSVGHFFCRDDNPIIPPEHDWLRGGDSAFNPLVFERTVAAAEQAWNDRKPAHIGATRGADGRVAFNRRYLTRTGATSTHAHCGLDEIFCTEGPTDPEVGVFVAEQIGSDRHIALLHHTCHPTFGYPKRYISSDWCGAWTEQVVAAAAKDGKSLNAMMINGCCGNVAPGQPLMPGHVNNEDLMGERLGETVARLMPRVSPTATNVLKFAARRLAIPLRELPEDVYQSAKKLVDEHPTPMWRKSEPDAVEWDWLYAISRLELRRIMEESPTFSYEVQAFRIGDVALLALVGEPFVESQLDIKLRSNAAFTFVAHMSNGYVGYIPTPDALQRGGYETWPSYWSKLSPEAHEMIREASVELINGLFEDLPSRATAPSPWSGA